MCNRDLFDDSPSASKVLIVLILFASVVFADDFKTVNGKEYKNAMVTGVEADGIKIKFPGGIAKVYCWELPPAIQKQYGCDPAKAAAASAQQAASIQQANQQGRRIEQAAGKRKTSGTGTVTASNGKSCQGTKHDNRAGK